MKNTLKYFAAFLFAAAVAMAGTITVWGSNDVLTASALNANFSHIHNTMVGGHGPRLMDSDVAANANVSYAKIGGGARIAKCWGQWTCAPSTCTRLAGDNATLAYVTPGVYVLTCTGMIWPAAVTFMTQGGGSNINCVTEPGTAGLNSIGIDCVKLVTGASFGSDVTGTFVNATFSLAVFDN